MTRSLKVLMALYSVLFVVLILNLTFVQFVASDKISSNKGNKRRLVREYSIERGSIYTSDGELLARSVGTGGEFRYQREYPQGPLYSNIVGYDSWRYGRSGIEEAFNRQLLGEESGSTLSGIVNRLFGPGMRGYSLVLTVDSKIQRAAAEALGNRKGAVVVIRPQTGEVLAMVTYPRFDPNALVPFPKRDVESAFKAMEKNPDKPLIDRCTMGRYPPGSSFKVVTAAGVLETGVVSPETSFGCGGSVVIHGYRIRDFGGKAHGELDFAKALVVSCNVVFAQVSNMLGATGLAKYARKFGLGERIPFDLPIERSTIGDPAEMDPVSVASSGIGQAEIVVTPFQMAVVACAIANGGSAPRPYIVREIQDYSGKVVKQVRPYKWRDIIEYRTAETLTRMMVRVVNEGTGTAARIAGVKVAGKTGTAETGVRGASPHSWFICFAPSDNPQVAVAVLVENGGEGGKVAAPAAKRVLLEAL